jgi:hypothetical protein
MTQAVAVSQRQTGRDQLAALARRLRIPDWQTRHDSDGVMMIAGARGHIKPVWGALLVVLRRSADPAAVSDETEASLLRELLGLHREGGR